MATPTYQELATMTQSNAFIDRVSMAIVKFAAYIISEDPGTSGHQRRFSWARDAVFNPGSEAAKLKWAIANDSIFTAQNPLNFATTPDSGAGSVQAAVEATINTKVLTY